ncbi:GatB/YqeY domain-containing protein [Patescibacteria group bacterium]|nr:GatB/YqeY domain-containing protein [Patescibacteria group bacterium]MBU4274507.1 GatB/YqeY domain-containing protein [Patescibacteria group bacterium]MBU4367412.1 GatB/YqeY domain-containing protein [Patescibacteria group bacterium]MBU4461732.1 GatB/YqeY domain-containing protein [Patescibacteria group bacterium]MCG2700116.1 GatB/YqeY domain-containing protein [Candidatus Parcubacteria bacterium]
MLKEEIHNSITRAMKENQEKVLSTLRMLSAAIISKEKEKRYKISKQKPDLDEKGLIKESQLIDEEVIDIIGSEIKKRKDAVDLYTKGNRLELADKEKKEIEILQKYLPEQLSEDEIKKIVVQAITKTSAKEMKDMGKVMAELMLKIKGRADASMISNIVKQLLSPK